ncbi:hypothetical protein MYX76_07110 [Desulfobacterota bacterium AH_259_B03_O07]|nr:hypothetical protein [Desulfobacterota bacterium AH_259_B03_O07]
MNYLNKLEEFISKESVSKESINKTDKPNIENRNEKFFTEEEKDILKKLEVNKKEQKVIENIKDIFGRNSRVIKGYKINFNNSRNPIEKLTIEKVANREKERNQLSYLDKNRVRIKRNKRIKDWIS